MATIKIKFKDIITNYKNVDVAIDFKCLNKNYTRIAYMAQSFGSATINLLNYYYGNGVLDYDNAYTDSNNTWTEGFNVIEIDPTQTNFQTFINAMKDNIEGVELEAGTYFWNENLLNFPTLTQTLKFISHSRVFNSMTFYYNDSSSGGLNYDTNEAYHWYSYADNLWLTAQYKRIVTTENQYISYDFYNYAILGNRLVKQTAPIIESGTYIFNDTLSSTVYIEETLIFTSNSQSFISINYKHGSEILNFTKSDNSTLEVYNKTWTHNENKTIVVDTDQVVPTKLKTFFDNNTTKQTTPTGTNKLKFGEITPTKLYMGETEVTKAYMGETLVYEKSSSGGETWLLNNTLTDYDSMYYGTEQGWYGDSEGFSENINFICDSVQYYGINPFNTHRPPEITMGVKLVYNNSTWIDEKYRKIIFATPPTGDLLTWLQANGVKQ